MIIVDGRLGMQSRDYQNYSAMTCLVACDAGKTLLVPICWIAKGIFPANTEVKTKK